MTIANALGEMFRRELQTQMVPLQQAVQRMEDSLEALDELREVTYRLEPLISRLGSMAGVRPASVLPAPVSARGRVGRPAAGPGPARRVRLAEGLRGCAVIGCERQSRSKGYCSAHYQKMRLLMKTNRRPAEWVDDAQPQSVQDVQLPRGRAASKALKQASAAPEAPPAPEAEAGAGAGAEAEAPAKRRGRGRGKAARAKRGARKQARQAKPARQAKAKAAKRGKRGGRK
jgi:histone H1/5